MEITGTGSQIQDYIQQDAKVLETELSYQVKLINMQRESQAVVGELLEDTAEISQQAMERYLAETNA